MYVKKYNSGLLDLRQELLVIIHEPLCNLSTGECSYKVGPRSSKTKSAGFYFLCLIFVPYSDFMIFKHPRHREAQNSSGRVKGTFFRIR